jgi:hypothetical protein
VRTTKAHREWKIQRGMEDIEMNGRYRGEWKIYRRMEVIEGLGRG